MNTNYAVMMNDDKLYEKNVTYVRKGNFFDNHAKCKTFIGCFFAPKVQKMGTPPRRGPKAPPQEQTPEEEAQGPRCRHNHRGHAATAAAAAHDGQCDAREETWRERQDGVRWGRDARCTCPRAQPDGAPLAQRTTRCRTRGWNRGGRGRRSTGTGGRASLVTPWSQPLGSPGTPRALKKTIF